MAQDLRLEVLLGAAPDLAAQLPAIERAVRVDSPILLLGEAGTGRTTLARAIHHASLRAAQPLIEVDPSTLPSTLFDSEFFGHAAGAFTGAEQAVWGRVDRAQGGTLLLDHVESLPLLTQPKLLRLLAERRYTPLGSRERVADVRFVAIGAEDLKERVERGVFRRDLFHRLEVLSFWVPPLRQRRADFPGLCAHLLSDLARRLGRESPGLSRHARQWMAEYSWPGNLRQLRNLLERALIMTPDATELDPAPPHDANAAPPRSLAAVEREHILQVLAYTRGHQGRAAELLGISRKSLWDKRRRFGIP